MTLLLHYCLKVSNLFSLCVYFFIFICIVKKLRLQKWCSKRDNTIIFHVFLYIRVFIESNINQRIFSNQSFNRAIYLCALSGFCFYQDYKNCLLTEQLQRFIITIYACFFYQDQNLLKMLDQRFNVLNRQTVSSILPPHLEEGWCAQRNVS